MSTWEQLILGVLVLVVLIWFFPGVKRAMTNSPKGSKADWQGLIVPLGGVVLFVVFLIMLVK